ncbi:hypothetical protein AAC387_Pa06g2448 [Persea americana]
MYIGDKKERNTVPLALCKTLHQTLAALHGTGKRERPNTAQYNTSLKHQHKGNSSTCGSEETPLGCKALHFIAALPAQGINQKTGMALLSSQANPGPETKKDTTAQRRHHNHYSEKAPPHCALLSLTQLSTSQPHTISCKSSCTFSMTL